MVVDGVKILHVFNAIIAPRHRGRRGSPCFDFALSPASSSRFEFLRGGLSALLKLQIVAIVFPLSGGGADLASPAASPRRSPQRRIIRLFLGDSGELKIVAFESKSLPSSSAAVGVNINDRSLISREGERDMRS